MKKLAAWFCVFSLAFLGLAPGCDGGGAPVPPEKTKKGCELNLDNLSGEWVKLVPTPQGDQLDERVRVKFFQDGGNPRMLATLGTVDKKVLVLSERREGDAIYVEQRDEETVQRFKEKNTDPNQPLQAKLYVRVNERRCQVQITESYLTYVNGELKEPQSGVPSFYRTTDRTYSWENCSDPVGLKFSEDVVDAAAIKPITREDRPLLRAVPAGKKGYFYLHVPTADMTEGCTQSFDVFDEDARVAEGLSTSMGVEGGQALIFDRTWEPAATGRFIEVYRYETCGGQKQLKKVSCGVVKPE